MADGEFNIITKRLQYIDNAVNRTIVGKFRINTVLRRIDIVNKGGDAFTLKVGTTDGGNELGEKVILAGDDTGCLVCLKVFDSDTPVYITGIAGAQINLFIIYDQDDEVAVNINGGGAGSSLFPKGYLGDFIEIADGDLEAAWDLASGLGKENTRYSNCAICDGRNGTPNLTDTYTIAVAIGMTVNMGTFIGQNSKAITLDQLPENNQVFGTDFKGGSQGVKVLSSEVPGPQGTITRNMGGNGDEIDFRPKSIYVLKFLAITD